MNLAGFVALRYLRSQHRPAILRIISWLSVLGVGAGVATLVVALAMNATALGLLVKSRRPGMSDVEDSPKTIKSSVYGSEREAADPSGTARGEAARKAETSGGLRPSAARPMLAENHKQ